MARLFSRDRSSSVNGEASIDRIRDLIRVATDSGAAEVEIENHGVRVLVRRHNSVAGPLSVPAAPALAPVAVTPAAEPAAEEAAEPEEGVAVKAPTPGTFYSKPAPDADPFVSIGDTVRVGDVLCIVEAMKLMNEVECETAGTVLRILVEDGQPVEFDQPLILVDPA